MAKEPKTLPVLPPVLSKALVDEGWQLIDALPFPVLLIGESYELLRSNRAAQAMYPHGGATCFQSSHGREQPCHLVGEACPKLQIAQGAVSSTVRHVHQTSAGFEAHLVSGHSVPGVGILELHLPLERSLIDDELTGLPTRTFFSEVVERQLPLLARKGLSYAVAMVDIDHFKAINDTHGHLAGDLALSAIGKVLATTRRSADTVSRWGGEEFCIFLPDTDLRGAFAHAERCRAAIASARVSLPEGVVIELTASIGVVAAAKGEALHDAIERADDALYQAKAAGRNCVRAGEG